MKANAPQSLDEARRSIGSDPRNAFISVASGDAVGPTVAVKDMIHVAGFPTTAGGRFGCADHPSDDAAVIARLRRAGFVFVGKTNMVPLAWGVWSRNPFHGDVENPQLPGHSAGGSSSGSAAAVAAGHCGWALGTDTAGSIRIPASLCGVVGYKPPHGSLPLAGVLPLAPTHDVVGPLARDVSAAWQAARIMADAPVLPSADSPPEIRLGVPAGWATGLDTSTQRAWHTAIEVLGAHWLVDAGDRRELWKASVTVQSAEVMGIHGDRWRDDPRSLVACYGDDTAARLENLAAVGPDAEAFAVSAEAIRVGRQRIDAALEAFDALITPTTAITAPLLADDEQREPLTRFTRPISASGHPAWSIPIPGSPPVGLQVIGRSTNEDSLASVAAAIEARLSTLANR